MKVLTEQRVIWQGDYFGINLKVYSNEHINFAQAAFLATDGDGELLLYWDAPRFDGYAWDGGTIDVHSVAQFEDVASDFAEHSLLEIKCS